MLSSLGFSLERAKACPLPSWDSVDGISLKQLNSIDFTDAPQRYGGSFVSCHRIDLHQELLRLATEADENPAILTLATSVESLDRTDGSLRLSDGSVHHADLIIGADGVHSAVRLGVLGPEADANAVRI